MDCRQAILYLVFLISSQQIESTYFITEIESVSELIDLLLISTTTL